MSSAPESARLVTALQLREKAARYRELARGLNDQRAIAITDEMSRACDQRAAEIEREIGTPMKADRSHAA